MDIEECTTVRDCSVECKDSDKFKDACNCPLNRDGNMCHLEARSQKEL